jgi:hypothetical protein
MNKLLLFVAVCCLGACSSPAIDDSLLPPPPAGQGVQYRMLTTIPAGKEVEHCQFFKVPAEGLNVSRSDVRFTTGSHHVLMYLTAYDQIPTHNDRGEPVDTSGVFDCSTGAFDGWTLISMVGGSQNPDSENPVWFPPGVAMPMKGGAVLLMNAHYINASQATLHPEVRMNYYTVPKTATQIEGGILFMYNLFIRVDALGGGHSEMSCPLRNDVTLVRAQSHMHRRGVGFGATAHFPDGKSQELYATDTWERVPTQVWPNGQAVPAGSNIQYFCDYQNAEDRTVWQGPKTSDEMCVFAAAYYPANASTSFCSADPNDVLNTRLLGANWIGSGTATCAETLSCLQGKGSQGLQGITDCVLASAPSESQLVSDVVRCVFLHGDDPVANCGAQISACANGP